MNTILRSGLTGLIFLGLPIAAHADSFQNLSEATGDSAEASARIGASGVQIALGAVAVPLALTGMAAEGVGESAQIVADDFWHAANAPLTVDEDIAIAEPLPTLPRTGARDDGQGN